MTTRLHLSLAAAAARRGAAATSRLPSLRAAPGGCRGTGSAAPWSVARLQWFSSYPPHQVVGLPSLSPTMETGSIAAWNVTEGAAFVAGDVFCSVETDKATVDFEAQDDGVVAKILVPAGPDEIKCGTPIMVTVDDADAVAAFQDFVPEGGAAAAPAAPAATVPPPAAAPPTPAAATAAAAAAAPPIPAPTPAAATDGGRVKASPLAHRIAKELGYDIRAVPGTGPGGRVVAADVREFTPLAGARVAPTTGATTAAAPAQAALAVAPPVLGPGYTDYALSDGARELAARLLQSKRNVPHYYLTVDVACDELLRVRAQLNKALAEDQTGEAAATSIGVYDLLIKAAALSMKTVPSVNASWLDSVVRVYDSVDINIVVGNGGDVLYTPVVRDAAGAGLEQIARQVADATAAASTAATSGAVPPELAGPAGTFTIMNLGMFGVKSCAPIIREPQACALAIGALENRIVPADRPGELYKESVAFTATLSCDHRVVDGAVGAQWLAAFKAHVESPVTLLL